MNNRNDEMRSLLSELEQTPPELEYTLTRAKAKMRSRKIRRFLTPVGSLCALALSFVLLVNVSPTFASACSGIPLVGKLAEAVDFSPSLTAAIENEFIQRVDEEQTDNGVTCRVLGVIVDRKQLNIFFTLQSRDGTDFGSDMEILAPDGSYLEGISHGGAWRGDENGIYKKTVDFFDENMPGELIFRVMAMEDGENQRASFDFQLKFDPYFTSKGEVLPVNESFELEGNRFTVTDIELYPTQMRINIASDGENSAYLEGLDYTVTDEQGNVYKPVKNGISAVGDPEGGLGAFVLDSPYFYGSSSLKLSITGAEWLDKDYERTYVDLKNQTAENLPYDTEFLYVRRSGSGWNVAFKVLSRGGDDDYNFHQVFSSRYYDAGGNEYFTGGNSCTIGWEDPVTGEQHDEERYFTEELFLTDFPGTEVWLEPGYTSKTELSAPVEIQLR
ncbi:MAG: DUF4179 domain-containing protein [Candidatus Heteroscillospira sp.]|jgi:hypothetical protein